MELSVFRATAAVVRSRIGALALAAVFVWPAAFTGREIVDTFD